MNIRKLLIPIGLLSALLIGAGVVGAQDATATPEPGRPGLRAAQIVGDIIAQETGLDAAQIRQQVLQGQTLSDIITANGGDVQTVIDQSVTQLTGAINQAVSDGTITQSRADNLLKNLQDRVTGIINGTIFPNTIDRTVIRRHARQILLQAVSDATGLSNAEIIQQVAQGKTLADVITSKGGSVDDVVNKAVATATEQINVAVTDKRLTQNQANNLISALPTLFTEAVNGQLRQEAVRAVVSAAVIRLAAQQTGLTIAAIRQEIGSGKTLGAILTEHHVDTTAFVDSVVAQAQQRLDMAVKSGRLTQDQENQRLDQLRTTLTQRLTQSITPEATSAPA